MSDSVLFPIVGWLLALYAATCIVQVVLWLSKKYPPRRTVDYTECPACGEIALRCYGLVTPRTGGSFNEYECTECNHYETGAEK